LVGPLAALDLHADRPAHVVAVLAHQLAQRPLVEILLRVLLEVQNDVGAARAAFTRAQLEVAARLTGPDPRLVAACRAREHRHRIGHEKGRIEADAELADQRHVLALLGRQRLHELARARARDRAEVRQQVRARHAAAVVADRQRACGAVEDQLDAQLVVAREQRGIRQRIEVQMVDRVARVADQLAQEHLAMAVERVDYDRQDLVDLGLERVLLDGHAHGMCGLPGLRTGGPDRIANRAPWIKQPPPPACAPGGVPARMAPIVYRRAAMRNTARSTAIGTATAWALALTAAAGSAA